MNMLLQILVVGAAVGGIWYTVHKQRRQRCDGKCSGCALKEQCADSKE